MPIRTLAPEIISKIAAGEVIERPASVVKELIENSLDAQATQISVEARDGGIELIKVSDNGIGIPAAEVELAFHRYTTSKVSHLEDLERICTLGFRGEALPSIAAVAEVEISTQTSFEAMGSYLYLRKGQVIRRESRARARGTTVIVHRLFRYFPARLKFLKSPNTENGHIAQVVSQYALAFPEVRFSLTLDKRPSLCTAGDGDLRQVVSEVYGPELAERMLKVEYRDALTTIKGLTSPPALSRSSRSYLSFFVNRRWVRSHLLAQALEEAYQGLLKDGQHPIAVIDLTLPPQEADVNVHPAKAQIKFWHEQTIVAGIRRAITAALSKASVGSSRAIAFPTGLEHQESLTLIKEAEPVFLISRLPAMELPVLRVLGQFNNTYIVAEGPDGLYLVDQHAAHERIIYERILGQWSEKKVELQGLLQPITIELNPKEEESLNANMGLLTQFGFTIEPFGKRSYLVRAIPALVSKANVVEIMSELLENLGSGEGNRPWEDKIAESLACHSAVRAGQQLSQEEMRELIGQLEQTKQPRSCPHGRPTMIHLSSRQLEKEFGRIS